MVIRATRSRTCGALSLTAIMLATLPDRAAAQSGMREGQPSVMQAPPRAPEQAMVAAQQFGAAYSRAGSPRITTFWNRSFGDEVTSNYKEVTEYDERKDSDEIESEERTAGPAGDLRLRDRSASERVTGRRSVGDERDTTKRNTLVDEPVDWDVENAFNATLAASGARMIDRSAIMRTQGEADGADGRANVQAIETRAITGKADLLVEVLQANDGGGIAFRVVVLDVRNAQILANFVTDGVPPTPQLGYVAGPNGFERARAPVPGPSDIGRQLAVETMQALARRWQ